jgi:hypothetical protein
MYDLPGGPSKFTVRNDLGNVKKIQREAKDISEASGGPYGQRKENKELSQGAPTAVEQPSMAPGNPLAAALGPINLLEQGNPEVPLSDGARGGPGRDNSVIVPPVDDFNQGEVLARAMYLANPTPQLARIVDAFNQEKRG